MTNEQAPFESPPAAISESVEAPQPKPRSGADPGLEWPCLLESLGPPNGLGLFFFLSDKPESTSI